MTDYVTEAKRTDGVSVISLRLAGLATAIASRTSEPESPGLVVKRELGRYYRLLADAAREIAFTLDEARVLVALVEPEHDIGVYRYLAKEIEGRITGIPDPSVVTSLVRKLSSLSPLACMAVIDMVERYHLLRPEGSSTFAHEEIDALVATGLLARHAAAEARRNSMQIAKTRQTA
jgi:hypothetical protein